jgi:hypothetical protein
MKFEATTNFTCYFYFNFLTFNPTLHFKNKKKNMELVLFWIVKGSIMGKHLRTKLINFKILNITIHNNL